MDYDKYIDLIAANKLLEATQYKSSCIPDIIYKYYRLDEREDKNEMRLSTLQNEQIYLSDVGGFNDPFEGHAFFLDEKELREKGWNRKLFDSFINNINKNAGICCFSNADEKEQNMPMWAYYANEHKGFCVEYILDEKIKKFMYPVSYDNQRANGNAIIGNIIDGALELIKKGEEEMSGELNALNHLAYLSLTSKHKSWLHEKEYRAVVPRAYGKVLTCIPNKIFIGMACEKKYEERLIQIGQGMSKYCAVYKMKDTEEFEKHFLKEEQII